MSPDRIGFVPELSFWSRIDEALRRFRLKPGPCAQLGAGGNSKTTTKENTSACLKNDVCIIRQREVVLNAYLIGAEYAFERIFEEICRELKIVGRRRQNGHQGLVIVVVV